MINRSDLLSFGYYKKAAFTGSNGSLRFKIEKQQRGEDDESYFVLAVITWNGPFASDKTPDEEKTIIEFPFEDASLDKICDYLNTFS